MDHICKVCGSVHNEKPRFCPECGSYFIDAADPFDGKEWRGMIRSDGTLAEEAIAKVKKVGKSGKPPAGRVGSRVPSGGKVFSILALISTSIVFTLNILSFITKEPIFVLGIPNFVFGIIIMNWATGWMKKLSGILIILSIVIGMIDMVLVV